MLSVGEYARANGVRLHPELDGVIVGRPEVLEVVCKAFGFRNRCESGKVYLTPRKIRELGALEVATLGADGKPAPRLAPLTPAAPVQSVSASINAIVSAHMPTLADLDDETTVVERLRAAKGGAL